MVLDKRTRPIKEEPAETRARVEREQQIQQLV